MGSLYTCAHTHTHTHTHTQTHTCQSSLIPCFIYYLELSTHDLASAGWYSVRATTFWASVYVLAEACNKVSMWPPAFRLVEPINLPLYSNTAHLWPSHIPIHIFFAGTPAQDTFGQQKIDKRWTLTVKLTCAHMLRLGRWLPSSSQDPSVVVSYYTLPLSIHTSLFLTSGLRACVNLRGILMSLSRRPAWISTSVFLSLSLIHISIPVTLLLFSLLLSHIQGGPQLSFGIPYSRKHHLSGCHLSPTLPTLQHRPHPSMYGTYPPQPDTYCTLLSPDYISSLNLVRKHPTEGASGYLNWESAFKW